MLGQPGTETDKCRSRTDTPAWCRFEQSVAEPVSRCDGFKIMSWEGREALGDERVHGVLHPVMGRTMTMQRNDSPVYRKLRG